ncbi:hypothetical protein DXX93_06710 [Thalassotalea euphylliae]|uniref:Uncharacterized protein n=1 Tax=Thalassotalea euphylliae TaxID=1655234 RepID=A0A3E0TPE2_9GAMM|nr:hypothetical protein [Thalassotalea euphylliae]REL26303.1 hypothetical protein DXX93_06710 [Thalassotalea euphylliae]
MTKLTFYAPLIALFLFVNQPAYAVQAKSLQVVVNPGKYSDYYHLQYELVPGKYQINQRYGFNSGGQFEVLIPKAIFPIPAPNCRKNIIVRMPYSANTQRKKALYDQLLAGQVSTTVTLELNPYVTVTNTEPLNFTLTYCNVFFRHKGGDYYNQLK